jgi:hypothetical protein
MGKGKWMAKCPVHREKTGSLSITDMRNGKTRLHCFAGCPQADVLRAIGLTWKDLRPDGEVGAEIKGRLADEAKLERLQRRYGLVQARRILEPENRRYWEAAARNLLKELEPLYWEVMPDQEKFDKVRKFEIDDYRAKRLDWIRGQHGRNVTTESAERVAAPVRKDSLRGGSFEVQASGI